MPTIRRQTVPSIVRPAGNRTRPSGGPGDLTVDARTSPVLDPSQIVSEGDPAATVALLIEGLPAALGIPLATRVLVDGVPATGSWADASRAAYLAAVTEGSHAVRVELSTGEARSATVTAPGTVNYSVFAPDVMLRIRDVPTGARVSIDGGMPSGVFEGAVWSSPVSVGRHTVRVTELNGARRSVETDVDASGRTLSWLDMAPPAEADKRVEVLDSPAPTLRIVGMPPYGSLFVDGAPVTAGSWANPATFDAWIVPLAAGTYELRVTPPTGAARTATVTVPATGERIVEFSGMAEVQPAAAPPSLRIVGMPPYGSLFVDGAPVTAGSWANPATFDAWIVPLAAGTHALRVVPPTGGGNARTATVVIPATGELALTFGRMNEERPAATPEERPPAVTTGTIVYQPAAPGASFETTTSAAVRAGAGLTAITLAPSGDNYSATVPAGTYTLEVIVQPFNGAPVPAGTPQPPARQYTIPVTITAGQTATIARSQLTGAGTPIVTGTPDPTPVTPRPGTGRVVIRTTLPNVAAMVQSLVGTQGELGPGRTAMRAADGSLVIDGLTPGRAQLVVWQEAEFPAVGRANVQQAPVTVIADADSVYAYTGTALTYVGGGATGSSVNPIGSTPQSLDAARGAYAQALFNAGASRSFVFLSLLGR